jgi:hypothetical protein
MEMGFFSGFRTELTCEVGAHQEESNHFVNVVGEFAFVHEYVYNNSTYGQANGKKTLHVVVCICT